MAEGAEFASLVCMAEGVEVAASRKQEALCGIELEAKIVENPVQYVDFRENSQE